MRLEEFSEGALKGRSSDGRGCWTADGSCGGGGDCVDGEALLAENGQEADGPLKSAPSPGLYQIKATTTFGRTTEI
jgi:hypothetical protein